MKNIFTLVLIITLAASTVKAQTFTCTTGTLTINLNTMEKVYHKKGIKYAPVPATATSTLYPSNEITLTYSSDVDGDFTGMYFDTYTAKDKDGLTVVCKRIVYVLLNVTGDCANGTMRMELNTNDTVWHKTNKDGLNPYIPVLPTVYSSVYDNSQITVKSNNAVKDYMDRTYIECYTATDPDGLKVECCRVVIVRDELPGKKCENGTLRIDLRTPDTVYHLINKTYNPFPAKAISTKFDSTKVQLTKISNVNAFKVGSYTDCFTAIDMDALKVECCRTVIVYDTTTTKIIKLADYNVSVYPNPIKDGEFMIKYNNSISSGYIDVSIYDIQGREVFSNSYPNPGNSELKISLKENMLDKGVYTLKLKQGPVFFNRIIAIQ